MAFETEVTAVAGVGGGDLLLRGFEGGVDVWWQVEPAGDLDGPVDAPDGAFGFQFVEELQSGVAHALREAGYGGVDFEEGAAEFVGEAPIVGEAELSGDQGPAGLIAQQEQVFGDLAAYPIEGIFGRSGLVF